jgi:tetratricopeptide (TPR) repeat protein
VLTHLEETTKAQKEFRPALSLDPGSESHAHPAARKKLKGAKEKVRQIRRSYSLATQPGNESDAEQLNGIAYALITAGLFDKAANILEIGLEKDPQFSYLYATKGLFYFRQGEIDRGRELYGQTIGMSPDDLDLQRKFHYEYGMALRIQGRFGESLKELERATDTASKYVLDAQIEMEILKAQRGDNSE